MKAKFLKVLATLCSVCMLLTAFGGFVTAHTFSTDKLAYPTQAAPVVQDYEWVSVSEVINIEQTAQYFIIHAKAGEHNEDLYISLPARDGGFRLQSKHEYQTELKAGNAGLFNPATSVIDYKTDAEGKLVMKCTDSTVLKYYENGAGFVLDVYNGSNLTMRIENGQIHFGYSTREKENGKPRIVTTMVEMPMDTANEAIYNGSQRYSDTNVVGHHFSLTNNDCFSDESFAYGNIPLFHSNRGYSIWFNMADTGEADFDCEKNYTNLATADRKDKYSILFYGDKLDFFMWTGEPLENLKKYTQITGTSGMTEEWTFGFWAGSSSAAWNAAGTSAHKKMMDLLDEYKERYGFYPEAIYGENALSSAESMAELDKRNVRMLDWISGLADRLNAETMAGETPLPTKKNGKFVSTGWPLPFNDFALKHGYYLNTSSTHIDMSNPSLKTYITNVFADRWNLGVAGSMLDMNEALTFKGICFNGLSSLEMHNLSSHYYAKYAREVWEGKYTGQYKNDHVLFQRSAAAGTQYYVAGFQGDQYATWDGYSKIVKDMISRGAGGFNLFGGDLGGLTGTPGNDLWNRWVVLSVFQPFMRQHGNTIHKPWEHDKIAEANFGKYYYLRKNIVPTIMDAAMDANKTSDPIVKGMMMAYPYALSLRDIDNQYLFCDDFLVCTVDVEAQPNLLASEKNSSNIYLDVLLPAGSTWYNLFTYETYKGQTAPYRVDAPNNFTPVYVKGGAVKAINLPDSMMLMDKMQDETAHASLLITPPDAERRTVIYNKEGQSIDFRTYDYTTETYVSKPEANAAFTVTNKDKNGSARQIVLALGVTAHSVSYQDTAGQTVLLNRLSTKPTFGGSGYGYYVDVTGMTTIYLPTGWSKLNITKGDTGRVVLKPTSIRASSSNETTKLGDDNPSTVALLSQTNPVTIDLGKGQNVGSLELAWTSLYYTGYTVSYSTNGYNYTTASTVTNGDGGLDVIDINATARYVRVTPTATPNSPQLADVTVYSQANANIAVKTEDAPTECQHEYPTESDTTCIHCGLVRGTISEQVLDSTYSVTVNMEAPYELKAGSLRFNNAKGQQCVPIRVGFQKGGTANQYVAPAGFDTEGAHASYEVIKPALDNLNVGNIGNSFNTSIGGMRFVSRLSRISENGVKYMVMADGTRYEIKDYGMLMTSALGLDTTPDLTTEQAMVCNSANAYVQKVSVMQAAVYYDFCDTYVDMAVTIKNLHGYKDVQFYARPYVVLEVNGEEQALYGAPFACNYGQAPKG